jgi:hypothetical protein
VDLAWVHAAEQGHRMFETFEPRRRSSCGTSTVSPKGTDYCQ